MQDNGQEGSSVCKIHISKDIHIHTNVCAQNIRLRSRLGSWETREVPEEERGSYVWHFEFVLGITQEEKRERGESSSGFLSLEPLQTTQTEWIKSSGSLEDNSLSAPSS